MPTRLQLYRYKDKKTIVEENKKALHFHFFKKTNWFRLCFCKFRCKSSGYVPSFTLTPDSSLVSNLLFKRSTWANILYYNFRTYSMHPHTYLVVYELLLLPTHIRFRQYWRVPFHIPE